MWSTEESWIYDGDAKKMIKKKVFLCPALLKIYDEILVNAADNFQREGNTTSIDISAQFSKEKGLMIAISNDGNCIPIVKHNEEKIYVPELVFGHMLTGSNFDDKSQRVTGGSHGYGAKLTNIFSSHFSVEIVDSDRRSRYHQIWSDNMKDISDPLIVESPLNTKDEWPTRSSTKITFQPDLKRFHMTDYGSDDTILKIHDILQIFQRRAIDIAACLNGAVQVIFNGEIIPIKSFEDYCDFFRNSSPSNVAGEGEFGECKMLTIGNQWQIAVIPSPTNNFECMSFVNTVWTCKGGSHVMYVLNQVMPMIEMILKKNKIEASSAIIKSNMMILVNCRIYNPSFEGQMKDSLLTPPGHFASSYTIPRSLLKDALTRSGLIERIIKEFRDFEQLRLESLTSSKASKRKMMISVPKLEDAHYAGTEKSLECTLILTEGDSAKALAVAGVSVLGRDFYGVMPLRGKLLNVRTATKHQIANNEEISHLCKALGLDFCKTYERGLHDQNLRYGKIMIMCDQDYDGSHIKGLIINFLHRFWPSLLKKHGFIQFFASPIVKVRDSKGNVLRVFFSLVDYRLWLQENDFDGASSTISYFSNRDSMMSFTDDSRISKKRLKIQIKYYKGLGTSTAEEGKEYFANIDLHKKQFVPSSTTLSGTSDDDHLAIDLAFSKDKSKERKDWLLQNYCPQIHLDSSSHQVTYRDFIDKELIHYSFSDNWRSIPSVVDGLKPSQRKVLFGCLQRFQHNSQESKVVQLAGYIAEKSAYHHGEASLHSTLVNMAQSFVGSNNIPVIEGIGQFGTRFRGGQDHASPRYIFARLSPLARKLFPMEDDNQLQYLEEDGTFVEPKWFLPIVPYLLINGSQGIGTGWSTNIPSYNILDIIDCIHEKLEFNNIKKELVPWYRGFKGSINSVPCTGDFKIPNDFKSCGVANRINKTTIEVTELPVAKWTEDYKEYLHRLIENGDIKGYREYHGTDDVKFIITAPKTTLDKMEADGLVQTLKLSTAINTSNMHAFGVDGRIKRYSSPHEIIEDYFPVRFEGYSRRKEALTKYLREDFMIAQNKSKFVDDIINRRLDLYLISKRSEDAMSIEMYNRGFVPLAIIRQQSMGSSNLGNGDYDYLLKMPLQSLTATEAISLKRQVDVLSQKITILEHTSVSAMWIEDLETLRKAYLRHFHVEQ